MHFTLIARQCAFFGSLCLSSGAPATWDLHHLHIRHDDMTNLTPEIILSKLFTVSQKFTWNPEGAPLCSRPKHLATGPRGHGIRGTRVVAIAVLVTKQREPCSTGFRDFALTPRASLPQIYIYLSSLTDYRVIAVLYRR